MRIDLLQPDLARDLDALEADWRDLESRSDPSFFQSWTWIGCRVRERFTRPVLIRAAAGGVVVGLALCNRAARALAPRALHLHESGRAAEDSVFVEHNGPLLARGHAAAAAPMLAAALRHGGSLQLSGVGDAVLEAARAVGRCRSLVTRPAPYARLEPGRDWVTGLGTSTRYQLRRARRRWEAMGPVVLRRAAEAAEATAFLEALAALHQATWTARGQRGAFAEPAFTTFHRDLVARGVPRGEVDLLRLAAGPRVVGYLYNFRSRGRVHAYQSGFDYAEPELVPGLACHHAAIEAAVSSHDRIYDFLAGEARYKTSLAQGAVALHWLELQHPASPRRLLTGGLLAGGLLARGLVARGLVARGRAAVLRIRSGLTDRPAL